MGDAEPSTNGVLPEAVIKKASDHLDISDCQLGETVIFAERDCPVDVTVIEVLALSCPSDMLRVYARGVAAIVRGHMLASWSWAVSNLANKTVDEDLSSFVTDLAVPGFHPEEWPFDAVIALIRQHYFFKMPCWQTHLSATCQRVSVAMETVLMW